MILAAFLAFGILGLSVYAGFVMGRATAWEEYDRKQKFLREQAEAPKPRWTR